MLKIERQTNYAPHWSYEQYEGLFLPDAPRRVVLVAEQENTVVGFLVAIRPSEEWELESVVVDESARRQGIGSGLIRELVAAAVTASAAAIWLEVRESNTPGRQVYEKNGFVQVTMRKDYYQGPLEHALLYRLTLQSSNKIP